MIPCRCILAGIDLGAGTAQIVSYAAAFARAAGAPVRLLYVVDFLLTPPSYLMPYIEQERKRDEAEMAKWQAVLAGQGVAAQQSIVMGRLQESFNKAVADLRPDLLIIGYASHLLRPSSSERLIKSVNVPMLVVRGREAEAGTEPAKIARILCAVDFSESSRAALRQAAALAAAFGAQLQVVHALPVHTLRERWGRWEPAGRAEGERFEKDATGRATQDLEALLREAGIAAPATVGAGEPAELICEAAEAGQCDLIVMGARGLSYIEGMLIGSVTEAVLKDAPCPVLIVR